MHYVDEGTGAPVLMVHGNPTWSFHYRKLVEGLRTSYRCIAPDHIGCGLSDKPRNWSYSILAHVDNLCELVETLDLRDATLVVQDWGGPIGYLAALRHPDRFRRFVVFNTGVFLLPLPKRLTCLRLPLWGPLVIRGFNGLLRAGLVTNRKHFSGDVRAGYLAPYDSWAHRVAIMRFVQEIPLSKSHPNRTLIAQIERNIHDLARRPHLVVWGLDDPVFHRGYLDAWRERIPDAEVHGIENASHWVVDEAHERVRSLVQAFLSRTA
jgi:haloalkane dehalogenase